MRSLAIARLEDEAIYPNDEAMITDINHTKSDSYVESHRVSINREDSELLIKKAPVNQEDKHRIFKVLKKEEIATSIYRYTL